jgi:Porin PorA
MKGVASKILIGLGIVLILAAILWWAIAVNALVKLPDDINSTTQYEGNMTFYVNLFNHQPLPEGQEMKYDKLQVERTVSSIKDQYNSSTGVLSEEIVFNPQSGTGLPELPAQTYKFSYVLDRKNMQNKNDSRAWAWTPQDVMERSQSYYPFLPLDTSKDQSYSVWKNEINSSVNSEFVNEEDKDGVTVYNFKGSFAGKDVAPAYVDVLNQRLGLPKQVTFQDIAPQLAAQGVDVNGLLALLNQKLSAADLQALQQPIPLNYLWDMDMETSIEPKTGAPVDVYKDAESLSAKTDFSQLAAVLAKYAQDPTLGPVLAKLQSQLSGADPQKIFEYSYEQTDESVKKAVDDAKNQSGKINVAKVYIPWALLIVGALILIIGLLIGGGGAPQTDD